LQKKISTEQWYFEFHLVLCTHQESNSIKKITAKQQEINPTDVCH